ncbi:MAG: nitroreductase family protein [Acidimicrobiales bacterium]|nr:nitroreductase family protein [Acidimicrobiales bacterium]
MEFDLAQVDALLSTRRSVRRRLDLDRPVPDDVLMTCLRLATQAPTGSNTQNWRWLVVRDQAKKDELARLYNEIGADYLRVKRDAQPAGSQNARVFDSVIHLADNLARVPVLVIPCIVGVPGRQGWNGAALFGSIIPAMWSFQLALRSRGLGTCFTTLTLDREAEVRALFDIPEPVTQAGLLPVAYTVGTDFKVAARRPVEEITYLDGWKQPLSPS